MTAVKLSRNFVRVIAFEPCRESFELLRSDAPDNVTASLTAVSDTDGEIELQEANRSIVTGQLVSKPGLHWGTILRSRKVQSATIESLVEIYGEPDFIKIDTEGHEVEVVRGGMRFLEAAKPRLCIEVHHEHAEGEIRKLLKNISLIKISQDQYREESIIRKNHFWLISDGLL